MEIDEPKIPIKTSYPYSDKYEYTARLKKINLDKKREESISRGKGFKIRAPQHSLKKNLKDPDSIFSSRFGQSLSDMSTFPDRYKCECGATIGRVNNGVTCKTCGTKVRFVDDDFEYFGWIVLKEPYYIIHPIMYVTLDRFFGKEKSSKNTVLEDILKPIGYKDKDGHSKKIIEKKADHPFQGIGMLGLKENINEILDFYYKKNNKKKELYDYIKDNMSIIFSHSIPVFTIHLRPYKPDASSFHYEDSNGIYNMMATLAYNINENDLAVTKKKQPKNELLYDMQKKYMQLYNNILKIISKKKGYFRTVFGGRYNFSSRSVIVPDPSLRIDEVKLPYPALLELAQLQIVNILQTVHQYNYQKAVDAWNTAKKNTSKHDLVYQIVLSLVDRNKPDRLKFIGRHIQGNTIIEYDSSNIITHMKGLPLLINRNPSINYGSILQMFCVGINDNYTMSMPLQVLPLLAADFDGDVLNILYIINKDYFVAANRVLNPRNSMYISKNDGMFNSLVNHKKDLIINLNGLLQLARKNYTPEQIEKIRRCKAIL